MCGICGFVGPGPGETLERMSILLRHRGPDDSGTWMSAVPPVHLASRRLGGLTGDVLGAANEVAHLATLLTFAAPAGAAIALTVARANRCRTPLREPGRARARR